MKKIAVATWNVRTMLDIGNRPERRTALIARELQLFCIEIAALQETRLEAQGQLQEEDYTLFWVGKTEGPREAGVAFAVHNTIAKRLASLPTAVSPRLMSMRVLSRKDDILDSGESVCTHDDVL